MKRIGGILVLALLITTVSAGVGAVYYFTRLETQKSDFLKAKAELRELREQVAKLKQTQPDFVDSGDTSATGGGSGYTLENGDKMSDSGTMIVTAPRDGESVGDPVVVAGRAIAFESTVSIRISDSAGNLLKETNTMTNAPDAGRFGDFTVEMSLGSPSTDTGVIEVFEHSAKDGSEINKVAIAVTWR